MIAIDAIDILQFRSDKVVAHCGAMKSAGMTEQMGASDPDAPDDG